MSSLKPFIALLVFSTASSFSYGQSATGVDAGTKLSIDIVNQFRQLRTSCNDQKGEARKMCYYRLRIGLWDYKEARVYLATKGIRVTEGAQVAKLH